MTVTAELGSASGPLERIGRQVTIIGSIIAALVGMNTALSSCSAQAIARHQTFRQAVEGEEIYWRNLYADYLAVFGKDVLPEERKARLFALSVLAQRDIPAFEEYSLGWFDRGSARALARQRLEGMKRQLREALARPETSDPQVAAAQQSQSFTTALQGVRSSSDRQGQGTETATGELAALSSVGSGVNYLPQTLAAGDPKGWDFDIFWCGGGGASVEALNYEGGLKIGRFLADLSTKSARVENERLGRVRLIMLPEARQGGIYPVRGAGYEIRPERGEAERKMAAALQAQLPSGPSFRLILSDRRTPFYISLFSCAFPGSRPAQPSSPGTTS
jgi:hypothetical protein